MNRLAVAGILVALASVASAQKGLTPTATLKFDKASVAPGGTVKATLTVKFAAGLHGYQNPPANKDEIPISVKVLESGFKLVKAQYPKGVDLKIAGLDETSKVYEGTIVIPLEIKASAKAKTYNVAVQLDYQQCTETSCYPPDKVVAKAKLKVGK